MRAPLALSIFIITKNEAERLTRTLKAIQGLANDVVIVDSGSTDDTVKIATLYGARVFINAPFPGYGQQKRFAEDQCQNDWILNVDADEVVSPQLYQNIVTLFTNPKRLKNFYSIRVVDMLPHEQKPARFAYSKYPIRLYNRKIGRFRNSPIHDSVIPQGKTGKIKAPLLHYSILSLSQVIDKFTNYVNLQSYDFASRGRKAYPFRLFLEFPIAFLKAYLIRRYIFRGLNGYLFSLIYANHRLIRLIKINELYYQGQSAINKPRVSYDDFTLS